MPKLLQINTFLNYGSTGRIAEQIALRAQSKGWECYIAHGARHVNDSSIKSIQIGTKWDNYLHAFWGEFLGLHGFGSVLSTLLFLRKIEKLRPDIVHLHNIHGYYINIYLLFNYLAKKGIPVVWTLHDCWSFTGHCSHFEFAGCEKWKTECRDCKLLMAQYKSRFFDRSTANFKTKKRLYSQMKGMTIVPVSNWLGSLISMSILRNSPVHVITNGIDLNIFKPTTNNVRKTYRIPHDRVLLLGVFSYGLIEEKGRKEFVELSKDDRYSIILVGISKMDKRKWPSTVVCIERTNDQTELADFYSAADVFLNPTYNDTLPTTNIEAIACGTPVVTYRTGGSPETIDENTGIVVEKGDFKGLINAIETIKGKGKASYSQACRQRALKHFNKDERFADYIELYNRCRECHEKDVGKR